LILPNRHNSLIAKQAPPKAPSYTPKVENWRNHFRDRPTGPRLRSRRNGRAGLFQYSCKSCGAFRSAGSANPFL